MLTLSRWERFTRPLPVLLRVWLFEQLSRFGFTEQFWRDVAREQDEEFSRALEDEFNQEIESVLSGNFSKEEE